MGFRVTEGLDCITALMEVRSINFETRIGFRVTGGYDSASSNPSYASPIERTCCCAAEISPVHRWGSHVPLTDLSVVVALHDRTGFCRYPVGPLIPPTLH